MTPMARRTVHYDAVGSIRGAWHVPGAGHTPLIAWHGSSTPAGHCCTTNRQRTVSKAATLGSRDSRFENVENKTRSPETATTAVE